MTDSFQEKQHVHIPKLRSYIIGYLISLALTATAFVLAAQQLQSGVQGQWSLALLFVLLALAQLFVQVFFFLHLNAEPRPRWNTIVFGFSVFFVLTVVIGSLWIMNNLKKGLHQDMFVEENISPEALGH